MISRRDFLRIKKELENYEKQREELIRTSRDILRLSKHAIYSVHNNDMKKAADNLSEAEKLIASTKKICSCDSRLDTLGAVSACMQEYAEAKTYYGFVKHKKIPRQSELDVSVEDYLLGLCDLTGELSRRSVVSVINNNFSEVYEIKDVVDRIFGLFMGLTLRNGELRRKSDSIKYNLKKIETVIYDIKTKGIDNAKDR